MSTKDDLKESLRELATSDTNRSETARLRDIFEDIETALSAGVKAQIVLETLHKKGFKMSINGFRSAIQRIRKERYKNPKNTISKKIQTGEIQDAKALFSDIATKPNESKHSPRPKKFD
jgi:DNA-binding winged helix-turn-helix (wHTH) protein